MISLAKSDAASLLTDKCWLFTMEGAGQFGLDAVTIKCKPNVNEVRGVSNSKLNYLKKGRKIMSDQGVMPENGFKKLHVAETVAFAIENIPTVNKETLEKFLQLVHTTGTAGFITPEQIVNKMRLTMKYIPDACPYSLMVLAELLELKTSALSKHDPSLSRHRLNGSQTTSPTTNRRPAISVTR